MGSQNICSIIFFYFEQLYLIFFKNIKQQQANGRQFFTRTILTQVFLSLFLTFLLFGTQNTPQRHDVYTYHPLPKLTSNDYWGVFNDEMPGNIEKATYSKRLFYSPSSNIGVQSLIKALTATYPDLDAVGCLDYNDMIRKYEQNLFDTWAYIGFELNGQQQLLHVGNKSTVNYVIMMNPLQSPLPTKNGSQFSEVYNDMACEADSFWVSGYMTLQSFVSSYLANLYPEVKVNGNFKIDGFVQRFPKSPIYPSDNRPNIESARWLYFRFIGSTVVSICLFRAILFYLTEMVRERQYRMKDILEISGLFNSAYYIGYLIFMQVILQITIWLPVIGLLRGTGVLDDPRVPAYGALFTCYSLGITAMATCFGFIMNTSEYYALPAFVMNTALTVGGIFLGQDYTVTVAVKLFLSFLVPPLGLSLGFFVIENYLHNNPNNNMDFNYENTQKLYPTLNNICGVMVVSMVFYMLIAIGMPFDWVFYKRGSAVVEALAATKDTEVEYPCDVEVVDSDLESKNVLLHVEKLSHIYADGTQAVSNISFDVREGEVLSFLGANGAGKSTCMGMLCGTLEATRGDATVNGYSISTDRVNARRNLGIAMQQDIIWNDLSVVDHLYVFGGIRGVHGAQLETEVENMIASLGFQEKRNSLAGSLSGGQKRRLCVALSMVGGNSVVYLDEPTAGLDPVSRRQLWELVQRNRKGRAILLTTHFMDEADVLGDRMAIVKGGRLRALGTSSFLKRQFGLGYLLRMSLESGTNVAPIKECIELFVPEASVVSSAGTEFSMRLPREAVPQFPDLLETLESQSSTLKVLSYGIETTTLEEVFLRIVNEDNEQLLLNHEEANKLLGASNLERAPSIKKLAERDNAKNPLNNEQLDNLLIKGYASDSLFDCTMILIQIQVIVLKRFYQFRRSEAQLAMGIVMPVVFAILFGYLISVIPSEIISNQEGPYFPSFQNYFHTPVGGAVQSTTLSFASQAFKASSIQYLSDSRSAMNSNSLAASNSVFYNDMLKMSNISLFYNGSYPLNFAGAFSNLINAAVRNATDQKLNINLQFANLPKTNIGQQMNNANFGSLVLSLFAGSLGAGISVIISGERVNLVKHQQLASGASKLSYWIANYLFDFAVVYLNVLILGFCLLGFVPDSYSGYGFGVVVGTGLMFTWAAINRFYVASFCIADVQMAQTLFFYGSLGSMFFFMTLWSMLVFSGTDVGNVQTIGPKVIGVIFSILDPVFGWMMIIYFQNNFVAIKTQNPGVESFSLSLVYFIGIIIGGVLYFLILFFYFEGAYSYILCCFNTSSANKSNFKDRSIDIPESVDYDVTQEKTKVENLAATLRTMNKSDNTIFINKLQKIYYGKGTVPTKVAVKQVSVSIGQGEVFGLLGANGAGKTTLLKMVSGLEAPTSGMALINGYNIVNETSNAQRSMGLCPQFDTLVERMTVRENLLYFGQIKGLEKSQLILAVEAFMQAIGIKKYRNKLIMQLSGGNRRKVSLAIALIGAPPSVYLDEPSTGLDPVASRLMWRLLTTIAKTKSTAIVLTTHNMLECEAVCTRICIMKMGEMVCLGDSQHLRSTHGTGFLLEMSFATPQGAEKGMEFVNSAFAGANLIDDHVTMLNYEIPRSSISHLFETFKLLESKKEELELIDYALSQSTLEQVFLKKIRINQNDALRDEDATKSVSTKKPNFMDYFYGYFALCIAFFLPGFHQFYLGNFWTGVLYAFTLNEVYAGWVLDLIEMHILVQKSVEQYGHTTCCSFCSFCMTCLCCCCCFFERQPPPPSSSPTRYEKVAKTTNIRNEEPVITTQV